MSALRILGFCYFAVASAFALGIATADQMQLREAMDAAAGAVSDRIDKTVMQPLLDFARSRDEAFFDPPPRITPGR